MVMRLSGGQRLAAQVASGVLIITGLGLFFSVFMSIAGSAGTMPTGTSGEFESSALRGFGGVLLMGFGGMLGRIAFLKPVAEITATEAAGALEHAGGALGRGLAAGGLGREVVKVRCRACGGLDTEDARFCSGCGQAM